MPSLLVIDDDRDVANTLAIMLQVFGYEAQLAANGQEALNLIRQVGAPDLIFLDIRMPVMDGPEFLERSRKVIPATPIVVVSAERSPRSFMPNDHRVIKYVPKPFSMTDIMEALELGLGTQFRPLPIEHSIGD